MELIDQTASGTGTSQKRTLTQVFKHSGGDVIRIRVERDFYEAQSFATAEIMTPGRTWTNLATSPRETWYDRTPLAQVAAELAVRAAKIVDAIAA